MVLMKFKTGNLLQKLLPLNSLEVGEFKYTILPFIWRKILKILCKLFPKLFSLCLVYLTLPEVDGLIIDLGCGAGYTFGMIKAIDHKSKIKGYSVGIDIFPSYLKKAKQVYDDVVLCDIRHLPIRRAELALLFGVLEHLEKREGIKLLEELKKTSNSVILTTTLGWHPWHPELDRNPYQRHRSAWFPNDLKRLGFKVIIYEHLKMVDMLQQKLPSTLRHFITPLSSIIRIKILPSNIQLAFILSYMHRSLNINQKI